MVQIAPQRPSVFGPVLRRWRIRRGMSQLALATAAGTPPRHVSFVETGRSRPGRDLVLRLAEVLDLPLRARNEMLVAAGLAPEYPERTFSDAALAPYRRVVEHMLGALEPYPAIVVDRALDIVARNRAADRLVGPAEPTSRANLLDLLLAPGGMRDRVANLADVAWTWHERLVGEAAAEELVARVEDYLRDVPRPARVADDLLVCPTLRIDGREIRTIGMTVRFAPGRDVALQELSIEVLYPRDEAGEAFFRG